MSQQPDCFAQALVMPCCQLGGHKSLDWHLPHVQQLTVQLAFLQSLLQVQPLSARTFACLEVTLICIPAACLQWLLPLVKGAVCVRHMQGRLWPQLVMLH